MRGGGGRSGRLRTEGRWRRAAWQRRERARVAAGWTAVAAGERLWSAVATFQLQGEQGRASCTRTAMEAAREGVWGLRGSVRGGCWGGRL